MSNVRAIRGVSLICNNTNQYAPMGGLAPSGTGFMRGPSVQSAYADAINTQVCGGKPLSDQKDCLKANAMVYSVTGKDGEKRLNPLPASSGRMGRMPFGL